MFYRSPTSGLSSVADDLNRSLGFTAEIINRNREKHIEPLEPADSKDLITVGQKDRRSDKDYGEWIFLRYDAAAAFQRLQEEAAKNGIRIRAISGYRSPERQAEIIREKIERGISVDDILSVNMPPGYSEHVTGRTIDVGGADHEYDLEVSFETTREHRWLKDNAKNFGFSFTYDRDNPYGIQYEPWHITYDPQRDPYRSFFVVHPSGVEPKCDLYKRVIALRDLTFTPKDIEQRKEACFGRAEYIPLIPELSAFPCPEPNPHPKLIIQDSVMTFAQALHGTPDFWPSEILARQELITVYYYDYQMRFRQGQLVLDYRLIPDILAFYECARYYKIPLSPAVPVGDPRIACDDRKAMEQGFAHCFNPRLIEVPNGQDKSKIPISPHGHGQAWDVNQIEHPVRYCLKADGTTSRAKPIEGTYKHIMLPANAHPCSTNVGTWHTFSHKDEPPKSWEEAKHPLVKLAMLRGWLPGICFKDFYDGHHFQRRLHHGAPTLSDYGLRS